MYFITTMAMTKMAVIDKNIKIHEKTPFILDENFEKLPKKPIITTSNYRCQYQLVYFIGLLPFCQQFPENSVQISPNVPAVYDVFASPIKETAGFQGLQKCGWS
jgi:hypothetical protein